MNKSAENKIVFITGASSGIGQKLAFRFAKAGADLIITYCKNKDGGQVTANECRRLGAKRVTLLPLDLISDDNIRQAINEVIKQYKQIDILINNAGTLVHANLSDLDFAAISWQLKANLEGVIKLTKTCLPYIKETIISVGSNLSMQGKRALTVYVASKFGLRGFTQSLAQEMPNLKVLIVNPGLTATRLGDFSGLSPEKVAQIIYNAAIGNYHAKSGADINIRDYLYGEFWRRPIIAGRWLKKLIKLKK